ncbi:hypothetical protein HNP84_003049 [Thermocatellispora tengchongensis]|uniref:DUF1206 domain-containing protein n=1 Tax=Thermocatellispora tengchongensis TaxID=1073253 RepID=A0A840P5Y9_9ACTN|nr:DUF1206 domain-containing protein [Thermocatellispora tengchongensis]MBB5133323.1 hypothetical protein [Thermocatellispora tengchongensis]
MGTVESAGRQARAAARRAADSTAMDRLARVGLACRGVLYTLIGVLALQIAFGDGGKEADKGGAIATVAALPFGAVVLWVMVAGFAALTVWQASEALSQGPAHERIESVLRVAVYVMIVGSLLGMLLTHHTSSEDQKSRDATRALLGLPFGQVLVAAIGLGLAALGAYWVYQGVTRRFHRELDTSGMPPRARTVMDRLGLAGYAARGAVAVGAGVFVVQAALAYDPGRAGGIDATLRAFARTPAGPWLLTLVAAGLVLYAGYCFGESRWRRV